MIDCEPLLEVDEEGVPRAIQGPVVYDPMHQAYRFTTCDHVRRFVPSEVVEQGFEPDERMTIAPVGNLLECWVELWWRYSFCRFRGRVYRAPFDNDTPLEWLAGDRWWPVDAGEEIEIGN